MLSKTFSAFTSGWRLLLSVDDKRETLHIRRKIGGAEHGVLHLHKKILVEGYRGSEKPDIPDIAGVSDEDANSY